MYMKVWPRGRAVSRKCALERAATSVPEDQRCGKVLPAHVMPALPAQAFPVLSPGHEYLARCTRIAGHAGVHISIAPRSRRYGKSAGKVFARWGDPSARETLAITGTCQIVFCRYCTTVRATR